MTVNLVSCGQALLPAAAATPLPLPPFPPTPTYYTPCLPSFLCCMQAAVAFLFQRSGNTPPFFFHHTSYVFSLHASLGRGDVALGCAFVTLHSSLQTVPSIVADRHDNGAWTDNDEGTGARHWAVGGVGDRQWVGGLCHALPPTSVRVAAVSAALGFIVLLSMSSSATPA